MATRAPWMASLSHAHHIAASSVRPSRKCVRRGSVHTLLLFSNGGCGGWVGSWRRLGGARVGNVGRRAAAAAVAPRAMSTSGDLQGNGAGLKLKDADVKVRCGVTPSFSGLQFAFASVCVTSSRVLFFGVYWVLSILECLEFRLLVEFGMFWQELRIQS